MNKVRATLDTVWQWLKSDDGVLIATLVFAPLGIYLIWRNSRKTKPFKAGYTVIALLVFFIGWSVIIHGNNMTDASEKYHDSYIQLRSEYNDLVNSDNDLNDSYSQLHDKYASYHNKMKPYEKLSAADAKKRERDAAAAQKVTDAINELPSVGDLTSKDEAQITAARKMYNALTSAQKELVDATGLTDLEAKLPDVKKKEAAAAAAKKKQEQEAAAAKAKAAEEERKGYETGITYSQLARTPDSYFDDKVKFYGEVIQVMEDDDSDDVQVRLAVNGDYDNVILCEWDSSTVSSRVLENDSITVYGVSDGLVSYDSTMGGKITIPSMTVDKIAQ